MQCEGRVEDLMAGELGSSTGGASDGTWRVVFDKGCPPCNCDAKKS